jgi:adenosine deaminase
MSGLPDLHRHLDGSLRRSTLEELARSAGSTVPEDLLFRPGLGLEEALARFRFTLSLLQSAAVVRRVADEICEDAAADGVTTLEIRFAPQLHGGSVPEIVDAALEGIAGRAGLVLCTLYGEDPGVAAELVRVGAPRRGVVGIDLAGGPATGHDWGLGDYVPAFRAAADAGLGRTVHASEGRPPAEIRRAVEALGANRIGHGTTLLDDPAIVDLVIEREITIEACPTSNVHVGVFTTVREHPLPLWLERGVRACVCTDNTLLSDVTATEELDRMREIPGMNEDLIALAIRYGHEGAFPR